MLINEEEEEVGDDAYVEGMMMRKIMMTRRRKKRKLRTIKYHSRLLFIVVVNPCTLPLCWYTPFLTVSLSELLVYY